MDSGEDFVERFIDYRGVREQMNDLDSTIPRFKQILGGAHCFLKTSAHKGRLVYDPYYLYVTSRQHDAAAIEVYYTFDSKTVKIHDICVAKGCESK